MRAKSYERRGRVKKWGFLQRAWCRIHVFGKCTGEPQVGSETRPLRCVSLLLDLISLNPRASSCTRSFEIGVECLLQTFIPFTSGQPPMAVTHGCKVRVP